MAGDSTMGTDFEKWLNCGDLTSIEKIELRNHLQAAALSRINPRQLLREFRAKNRKR